MSSESETLKWLSLFMMLVQNAFTPIFMRLAATSAASQERYNASVAVLAAEIMKLVCSFLFIFIEEGYSLTNAIQTIDTKVIRKPTDTLQLSIPAVLYFIQNVVSQFAASNLPAALYKVTYQGKTLVTALCSVILLQKQLTRIRWLAIALMAAGIATVQLSNAKETKQSSMANAQEQNVHLGLAFVFLACLCSGFSGVYFEMVMKTNKGNGPAPSMWVRNFQLALFSILICTVPILIEGEFQTPTEMFHGFNNKVWLMTVNNAVGGLVVAFVIRHADNILKGFATALATIVAALAAVPLFGFELSFGFFFGMSVVVFSALLYDGNVVKINGEFWNSEPSLCKGVRVASTRTEKDLEAPSNNIKSEEEIPVKKATSALYSAVPQVEEISSRVRLSPREPHPTPNSSAW